MYGIFIAYLKYQPLPQQDSRLRQRGEGQLRRFGVKQPA